MRTEAETEAFPRQLLNSAQPVRTAEEPFLLGKGGVPGEDRFYVAAWVSKDFKQDTAFPRMHGGWE